jgi:hypothetical protein
MIKEKKSTGGIEVDLTGPQGNAFYLLGLVRNFGRQLGWSSEEIIKITNEMMGGDYENLISVFDREFGSFVTLYR